MIMPLFQGTWANHNGKTCVTSVCAMHRLHKLHVAISRPSASTPQFSVVGTLYTLAAPHITYPKGMESRVKIVSSELTNLNLQTGVNIGWSEQLVTKLIDLTKLSHCKR